MRIWLNKHRMIKNLYNCFSHWHHGGSVYFYSDPHFGDAEIHKKRSNNISDDEQVARINKVVRKSDTLIILGDVGDTEYVKKLNGYKVLIMGNHDRGSSNYLRVKEPVDNKLFDEVYESCLMISERIMLSHEPYNLPFALNIHGHDHAGLHRSGWSLNVCAELIDYQPMPLSVIIKSGILKDVPSMHRWATDFAINRKLNNDNTKLNTNG